MTLKLKAAAKILPSMLPAYKFHSCSYRLYSYLKTLLVVSLSKVLVLNCL